MLNRLHKLVEDIRESVDAAHVVVVSAADLDYLIEMGEVHHIHGTLRADPSIRVVRDSIPDPLEETPWWTKQMEGQLSPTP